MRRNLVSDTYSRYYHNSPMQVPDDTNDGGRYERALANEENTRKFNQRLAKSEVAQRAKPLGKMYGVFAGFDTVLNMRQGDDLGTAAAKSLGSTMLWDTAPWIMGAYTAATTLPGVVSAANSWYRQRQQWYNIQHLPNFGGGYRDTQRALTMRQAGVEAIQGSKLNARSALGGEARILAQGMYRQNGY